MATVADGEGWLSWMESLGCHEFLIDFSTWSRCKCVKAENLGRGFNYLYQFIAERQTLRRLTTS